MLNPDRCWDAVTRRDADAAGQFLYGVRTSGVYCRPACPSRLPNRRNVAFFATAAAAEAAGLRACKRCRPAGAGDSDPRIAALDWPALADALDARGYANTGPLLDAADCAALVALYDADASFRSTVVMQRHAFGRGAYKYFARPLPPPVERLRAALYPPLAAIANRWRERLREEERFPSTLAAFLAQCHAAGQTRPTPLLLRYGPDDYNCLHQDLYGALVFPLQLTILLSDPGDFAGGEFLLVEQRPRMQSKAEVVPLRQGEAVIFAVSQRPAQGTRGTYQVTQRHGVSRVRVGLRHTLGIIFHDAA